MTALAAMLQMHDRETYVYIYIYIYIYVFVKMYTHMFVNMYMYMYMPIEHQHPNSLWTSKSAPYATIKFSDIKQQKSGKHKYQAQDQ